MESKKKKLCRLGEAGVDCDPRYNTVEAAVSIVDVLYSINESPIVQKEVLEPMVLDLAKVFIESDKNIRPPDIQEILEIVEAARDSYTEILRPTMSTELTVKDTSKGEAVEIENPFDLDHIYLVFQSLINDFFPTLIETQEPTPIPELPKPVDSVEPVEPVDDSLSTALVVYTPPKKGFTTQFVEKLSELIGIAASAIGSKAAELGVAGFEVAKDGALQSASFVGQKAKDGSIALGSLAAEKALEGASFVGEKLKDGALALGSLAVDTGKSALYRLGEAATNSLNDLIGEIKNAMTSTPTPELKDLLKEPEEPVIDTPVIEPPQPEPVEPKEPKEPKKSERSTNELSQPQSLGFAGGSRRLKRNRALGLM